MGSWLMRRRRLSKTTRPFLFLWSHGRQGAVQGLGQPGRMMVVDLDLAPLEDTIQFVPALTRRDPGEPLRVIAAAQCQHPAETVEYADVIPTARA